MIASIAMKRAIREWTRRQSGTWRAADESELQAWLAAADEHRAAFEKVGRAWDVSGGLREHVAANDSGMGAPSSRSSRASVRKTAVAACVVLLAIAVFGSLWPAAHRWWSGAEIRLATARGQPRTFVLDDGTRVLLDADSELVAQIGFRSRQLSLLRGEALLTVSHDASRAFEVRIGRGRVQDLGTEFDIEYLAGAARISVLEGRVGVFTSGGRTLLLAGQTGGYDSAGNLTSVGSFDAAATHWSEGLRHYDREALGDVIERMGRYHAVTFVFAESRLQDLRVSGTFKTSDLPLFLRTLAAALPVEMRYLTPEKIEIASRSPPRPASDSH